MMESSLSKASKIKHTVSVLESVISSKQRDGHKHDATPTEFFAAILSLILANADTESLPEFLEVMEAVIPQASKNVVISQFKVLSSSLITIAKMYNENRKLLRCCLGVLGSSMCAQEATDGFWSGVSALQTVNALLTFLDDSRTRIRKTSSLYLTKLITYHRTQNCNTVRSYVAEFVVEVMKSCSRSEYRRSLFVVLFLESVCPMLPDCHRICDYALRLQACEQPVLTAAVFRMMDAVFQNPQPSMTANQTNEILRGMMSMRPSTTDMESNTYFFTALASGMVLLQKLSPQLSSALLPSTMSFLVQGCETEFTQIHCAIGTALKRIITSCVDNNLISEAAISSVDHDSESASRLSAMITTLEPILQLRNQNSWVFVMDGVRCLYERVQSQGQGRRSSSRCLDRITVLISDVYQAADAQAVVLAPGLQLALYETLGTALRTMGLTRFLEVVPMTFEDTPSYAGLDKSREWILGLLHSNLRLMRCSLNEFLVIVLSKARACSQVLRGVGAAGLNEWQLNLARRRALQLWSLFPDFCVMGSSDLPDSFPRLAKILSGAMQDAAYPELLPIITCGLSSIINNAREKCPRGCNDSVEISVLQRHAEVFLPLLLNLLEGLDSSKSHFQSCVLCVGAWATVSPPALLTTLSKKLLQLLLASTVSSECDSAATASGWMSVMLAVIPHLPAPMVTLLYRTIRPLLSIQESLSLQKRAYLVLEALIVKHASVLHVSEVRLNVLAVISDSLLLSHVSARHMRLRCMEALLGDMTEEEMTLACGAVLGEVLICQKDANKKTRDAASAVLRFFAKRMPARVLFTQLCSGVVGETSLMRSSAIVGLCLLLVEHRQDEWLLEQMSVLLPTLVLLFREECAEQTRACLAFIRVCVSVLPIARLTAVMRVAVEATLTGLGQHKAKFASRERAIIRKLSQRVPEEELRVLVPETDLALLAYIQKQARRSQRRKETRDEAKLRELLGSDDEADGSSDADSDEEQESRHQGARPKATRAADVVDSFSVPTTLDDLLEDQSTSYSFGLSDARAADSLRRSKGVKPGVKADESEDEEYSVKLDSSGKLVVEEKAEVKSSAPSVAKGRDKARFASDETGDRSHSQASDKKEGSSKKRKMKEPGEEYRSKKSGGDVWRRGMLEPHAFIPLDAKMLSKKNHKAAVSHFGAVVTNGKKKRVAVAGGKHGKNNVVVGNRNQRRLARSVERMGNDDDDDDD